MGQYPMGLPEVWGEQRLYYLDDEEGGSEGRKEEGAGEKVTSTAAKAEPGSSHWQAPLVMSFVRNETKGEEEGGKTEELGVQDLSLFFHRVLSFGPPVPPSLPPSPSFQPRFSFSFAAPSTRMSGISTFNMITQRRKNSRVFSLWRVRKEGTKGGRKGGSTAGFSMLSLGWRVP